MLQETLQDTVSDGSGQLVVFCANSLAHQVDCTGYGSAPGQSDVVSVLVEQSIMCAKQRNHSHSHGDNKALHMRTTLTALLKFVASLQMPITVCADAMHTCYACAV